MRRLPVLNAALSPDKNMETVLRDVWQRAYAIGKEQGFRHAHLTGFATPLDMQALLGVTCRDIAPEAACVRFEGFFGDGADGTALLFDSGHCEVSPELAEFYADATIARGEGTLGRVWQSGVPGLSRDLPADPSIAARAALSAGLAEVVAMPVIRDGRLKAVVAWYF